VIQKIITGIGKEDIESLISGKVSEGRTLDYKQKLPERDSESKREFLYDVSSFANASGGDMVFGIADERDSDGKATGLPASIEALNLPNASDEIARWENLLRDSITPRIQGIQWRKIEGFQSGSVLVMRIPKSLIGPHMVVYAGMARFYSRNSTGKYPMEYGEIRSAFVESTNIGEKLRAFREKRLIVISNGESSVGTIRSAFVTLHLMPLSSFFITGNPQDVVRSAARDTNSLQPFNAGGWEGQFNFDGFLSTSGNGSAYVQVFRDGSIEATDVSLLNIPHAGFEHKIPTVPFEKTVIASVKRYLGVLRRLEIPLPIFVAITLSHIKGFTLSYFQSSVIDRNDLLLPEAFVEDYDAVVETLLRPAFDTVWQACGHEQSLHYDKDGNWRPHG
jgi:hypothetical protein